MLSRLSPISSLYRYQYNLVCHTGTLTYPIQYSPLQFEAANITIPQCTVSGDEAGEEGGEGLSLFPEHCYNTSYEQQARIYLRYQTLTTQYIPTDIDGVLQQKAGN